MRSIIAQATKQRGKATPTIQTNHSGSNGSTLIVTGKKTALRFILSVFVCSTAISPTKATPPSAEQIRKSNDFLDNYARQWDSITKNESALNDYASRVRGDYLKLRGKLDDEQIRSSSEAWNSLLNTTLQVYKFAASHGSERSEAIVDVVKSGLEAAAVLRNDVNLSAEQRQAAAAYAADLKTISDLSGKLADQRHALEASMTQAEQSGLLPPNGPTDSNPNKPIVTTPMDRGKTNTSKVGAWRLSLDQSPSAVLLFKDAEMPGAGGGPNLKSLTLSCAGNGALSYRLDFLTQRYNVFILQEGEDSTDIKINSDGIIPPAAAALFVSKVTPSLNDYDKHKSKDQYISIITPDMKGGDANFYGFLSIRNSLKAACSKQKGLVVANTNQTPVLAPNSASDGTQGVVTSACLKDRAGDAAQCACTEKTFRRSFGANGFRVYELGVLGRREEAKQAYKNLNSQEQFNFGMGLSMMFNSANQQCHTHFRTMQSQSLFR